MSVATLMDNNFTIDMTRIRDEARQHLKQGPVTPSDTTDVERVITVLNQVIASEMVCYPRYTQNAIVARGINRDTEIIRWLGDADIDELNNLFEG